jgi:hypothetical protein
MVQGAPVDDSAPALQAEDRTGQPKARAPQIDSLTHGKGRLAASWGILGSRGGRYSVLGEVQTGLCGLKHQSRLNPAKMYARHSTLRTGDKPVLPVGFAVVVCLALINWRTSASCPSSKFKKGSAISEFSTNR